MAQNPTISELDANQIMSRVYDEANDSFRMELGANSGMDIQLDASTDSITSVAANTSQKASVTAGPTGVILPPFSVVGMTAIAIYSNTTTTLTGPQVCTVQVNPSGIDDVWVSIDCSLTPSTTEGTCITSSLANIAAVQAQVIMRTPITSGTFDIYAVAN